MFSTFQCLSRPLFQQFCSTCRRTRLDGHGARTLMYFRNSGVPGKSWRSVGKWDLQKPVTSIIGSSYLSVIRGSNSITWMGCRTIKTSSPDKALPPLIVIALSRISQVFAVLLGRRLRFWWKKLPPEEKAKYAKKASKNRYYISGLLGALLLASYIYYENRLFETPFTKRKRFLAFTEAQFDEMSKYELEMMLQLYKDKIIAANINHPAYRRVVSVAQRLLKANQDLPQIHNKEWTITVVDEGNHANAFVLPCGKVFVFSGLLKVCETDDELGIILGHEMAHAVMGHGAEKASLLQFMDFALIIPLGALWAIFPTDITAGLAHLVTKMVNTLLMELPHSRFIEHEADQVGLLLAAKACFDVRHCLGLWDKMALMSGMQGMEELNLEWLSTHPGHDKRQHQLEELLPAALSLRDKLGCYRLQFYDAKAEVLKFEKKIKNHQKLAHASQLMPVTIR